MDPSKQQFQVISIDIQNTPADCSNLRKQLLQPLINTGLCYKKIHSSNNIYNQESNKNCYNLSNNGLFDAFYAAYILHGEVEISADDIWIQVCHMTSKHINDNAEICRNYFVEHEGKKLLTIYVDGFSEDFKDFPHQNNNWPLAMELFSQEINKNTKKGVADSMRCDFSTTSYFEKAASNIITMSSMKAYFDYRMMVCGCGIQKIHFKGQKQDYDKLIKKLQNLKDSYPINPDYVDYLDGITKIVNKFIETIEGKVDLKFWNSIFEENKEEGYGPSGMRRELTLFSGWMKNFFGVSQLQKGKIPSSQSSTPVEVIDQIRNKKYELEFVTETTGIEEIRANVFRPLIQIDIIESKNNNML